MSRRTYWHLEPLGRRPTDYEIGTSRLLYHMERGPEVATPLDAWYQAHQRGSALPLVDAESFADPLATTYASYTERMRDKEVFVERLLACEAAGRAPTFDSRWIERFERIVGPLRYPVHGLQMIAAYIGSMAPSGRIAVTCLFQSADELRRVELLTQRMCHMRSMHPSFGRESRAIWENDSAWQPLRRAVEQLLVTYDWAEALIALNGVVKPLFDDLFLIHLGALARAEGDDVLEKLLQSLHEDARWHRDWFAAWLGMALAESDGRETVLGWRDRWESRAFEAIEALEPLFDADHDGANFRSWWNDVRAASARRWRAAEDGVAATGWSRERGDEPRP
jgi:toluene monooxygenase system protein E